jgi:predicted RNA polymerase sigma factor
LSGYHLLSAIRGDLLLKLGRFAAAREEIKRALTLTHNEAEQALLRERLKHIDGSDIET